MKPKILVLTKRVKSYWKSPFAQKRVTKFIESKSSSFLGLLQTAINGFFKSPNYDLVICADPRIGTLYGLLKRIIPQKTPVIIDQLILDDNNNFLTKLKDIFYKIGLQSVTIITVNSSFEINYYKKRLSNNINFVFLPIPAEDFWFKRNIKSGNYIFSGGGEKRDFASLVEVAKKINHNFKIVTFSSNNLSDIKNIPPNCEIIYKVSNKKYIDLIGNSQFVVLPLLKSSKSAGQTTLVQALCQGKKVVVADNPAILDYAKENCILYKPEDQNDLYEKINYLINSKKNTKTIKTYSYAVYDKKMGEIINLCLRH